MALLPFPSRLLSPSAFVELTRSAVGQVIETAAAVATIPVRAMSLLGQAELLVTRITVLADSAEGLIARVSAIVAEAQVTAAAAAVTVEEAAVLTAGAAGILEKAAEVSTDAGRLVGVAGVVTADAERLVGVAGGVTGGAAVVLSNATAITERATSVVAQAETATADVLRLLDGYTETLRKAAPLAARFVDELSPEEVTAAIKMVDELPRLREHLVSDVMPLLGKLDQVGPDLHNLLEVTKDLHLAIAGLPGLKMFRRRGEERVAEEEAAAKAVG